MNNNYIVNKSFIPRLLMCVTLIITAISALFSGCEKQQQPVCRPSRFKGFYSDGEMLFILEKDRLLQCDIDKKTKIELLKGDIRVLYIDSEYIIYSDGKNLKTLERSTGATVSIMEFKNYIRPAEKTQFKVTKLIKTEAFTRVSNVVRKDGEIYFLFDTGYELRPDKYSYYGSELWNTLYRYDMKTKTLYPIQTGYYLPEDTEDILISGINAVDEYIYFMNDRGCLLRMNEYGTENVYEYDGTMDRITWKEDGFDCFVYKKRGEDPQNNYFEFISFDKNGNVLFEGDLREMLPEEFMNGTFNIAEFVGCSIYDSESDRYLFMDYNEVKSVTLSGNARISTVAVLDSEKLYRYNESNIMPVRGHIFVSARDAVYGGGYSVFDISPTGEVSTFIKADD